MQIYQTQGRRFHHKSTKFKEEDFHKSTKLKGEDFHKFSKIKEEDSHKSTKFKEEDFHKSNKLEEEDFHKSTKLRRSVQGQTYPKMRMTTELIKIDKVSTDEHKTPGICPHRMLS
jgi:hypothetical protein